MFENILHQDSAVSRLKNEFTSGTVPQAILFEGPDYSGKLSTALELARGLTCEQKTAEWNCTCTQCLKQRMIQHGNTLLLGSRYFYEDISASAYTLLMNGKKATQYLFFRSVSKLLRRFDPILWGDDTKAHSKVSDQLEKIEEIMWRLSPKKELPKQDILDKYVQDILTCVPKVQRVLPEDTIPVKIVRNVINWTHIKSTGSSKIVIIENADKMQASSANALLKILEEPPASVYIILLTKRRGNILPTIRSRVRSYSFFERSPDDSKEVLQKIFRIRENDYTSLRHYFLFFRNDQAGVLINLIEEYLVHVFGTPKPVFPSQLREKIQKTLSDKRDFRFFLEEITGFLEKLLKNPINSSLVNHDLTILEVWQSHMQRSLKLYEQYNIQPSLVLENLFYDLKDSL